MSKVVERRQCPECAKDGGDTAKDNLAVYDDNHVHCHACGYHKDDPAAAPPTDSAPKPPPKFINGTYCRLEHRKLTEETCKTLDYRLAKLKGGNIVEIASYWKDGELVGQKIRSPGKKFFWKGTDTPPLYGQHLWKPGGKRLIITEGEIDALTVSQCQDNKWPVVSLPHGACKTGEKAANAIRNSLDWVSSFDQVVFAFDMDEPGQNSARRCAELLPPGKACIATLPEKDPNDVYRKYGKQKLIAALWNASPHRPDGIVHIGEVKPSERKQQIWPYPWREMTEALMGQRSGEMIMYTSGTGMGKSTLIRELAIDHLEQGRKVGMLMLEESVEDTRHDMMSLLLRKPIRQIMAARELNEFFADNPLSFDVIDDLADEEYAGIADKLAEYPLYLYDHRGSNLAEDLLSRLEYMAVALECDVIFLDHISVVVSHMHGGNERKDIDSLMSDLRSLVERTGVHLCVITQLRKNDGKPYEEGGRITLHDLRGSGSLASVPNSVLALERNQQAGDPDVANTVIIRALKGRFNGKTGIATALMYNRTTGRFEETEYNVDSQGNVVHDEDEEEDNERFNTNLQTDDILGE